MCCRNLFGANSINLYCYMIAAPLSLNVSLWKRTPQHGTSVATVGMYCLPWWVRVLTKQACSNHVSRIILARCGLYNYHHDLLYTIDVQTIMLLTGSSNYRMLAHSCDFSLRPRVGQTQTENLSAIATIEQWSCQELHATARASNAARITDIGHASMIRITMLTETCCHP